MLNVSFGDSKQTNKQNKQWINMNKNEDILNMSLYEHIGRNSKYPAWRVF